MTIPGPKFPWSPLEARVVLCEVEGELCTSRSRQAELLGVPKRQIYRFIHDGLSFWQADKCAIRVGVVPYVIWSEWLDVSIRMNEAVHPRCDHCGTLFIKKKGNQKFCSIACRDEKYRPRKNEINRAYKHRSYRENPELWKARSREHYWETADYQRSRRRRYRASLGEKDATEGGVA